MLEANKLYDRANKLYKAALLKGMIKHLLSPYINSEVNHKRHFIKIQFINKGMEFIDLHSIFKDNLFHLFQITLIVLKLLSFAINITHQLGLLFLNLTKL